MSFNEISGPVIHIGIASVLALLFRLNLVVTVFCAILPDLVDKPLAALGIGGGRYIGHTLLFAAVITGAFFLWKRRHGFAAIMGLMSHLLLDLNGFVPWFYPFKEYNFPGGRFSFTEWLKDYLTFSELGYELTIVVLVGLVAFTCWWLYRWYARRKKQTE